MVSPLSVIGGRAARRAFERADWTFDRQRGSHVIPTKPGVPANLSVPDHREIYRVLLRALIGDADLTVNAFVELL